jgi:hypothetical protein
VTNQVDLALSSDGHHGSVLGVPETDAFGLASLFRSKVNHAKRFSSSVIHMQFLPLTIKLDYNVSFSIFLSNPFNN